MSAIAGICHIHREPVPIEQGNNLMKRMNQFPADKIQSWHTANIFFGCHAQWMTPESVGEELPFFDQERKLAITADAIIDNREELFERLQVHRSKQTVMTDSQLILRAYEKWGEEAPKYLVGDFAFMIWDERKQKLFGARDFSGGRTLYFHHTPECFAFCTIINPLLTLPSVKKKLNEEWLAEFLVIPGMVDTATPSISIFQDISQIPPAHSLSIDKGKLVLKRYVSLEKVPLLKLKSDGEYMEAFQDVFHRAVTSRLRTHRNVGAQLSGGLDSSSVVSVACKELQRSDRKIHTFSSVPLDDFQDWTPQYFMPDERPLIKETVQHVGNIIDHYESFPNRSPYTEIEEWLDIMEMPYKFFENSYWIKGIYERAAENNIGILLSGSRGNFSISWGPPLEYFAHLFKKLQFTSLLDEINLYGKQSGARRSRIIKAVGKKVFPFIRKGRISEMPRYINPAFLEKTKIIEKINNYDSTILSNPSPSILEVRENHFNQVNVWNATNTSGTKLSLRYGVQSHDPTNDLRVIKFCLSLPLTQFVQQGLDRALIRRSMTGLLPDKVRLNCQTRGLQGSDIVQRLTLSWNSIIDELLQLNSQSLLSNYIDLDVIKGAISQLGHKPHHEFTYNPNFRMVMRSLILNRFLMKVFS